MKLSIVVVNYNTKKLVVDCLQSILESKLNFSWEVIMIDNNSSDGSVKEVRKHWEKSKKKYKLTVIENEKNLGYGKANNQGMKRAKGDFILLLNSDTKVIGEVIFKAIRLLGRKKKEGVLGCKLLNKDGSVQPSAGYLPRLSKIFFWSLGISNFPLVRNIFPPYHINYFSFYKKEHEVGWVTGAFFLLKREVFEKTKGFDEKLFMYGEEVEWCKRIKKNNFKIFYSPVGAVFHLKGGSKAGFEKMIEREYKGLIYYFKKHKPKWELPILKCLLLIDKHFKHLVYTILGDKIRAESYARVNFLD